MAAIEKNESEIAPSSIYAAAAILEGVPFINGSPQNTFVPGLIKLAVQKGATAPPVLGVYWSCALFELVAALSILLPHA